jgi:hypothetical protein
MMKIRATHHVLVLLTLCAAPLRLNATLGDPVRQEPANVTITLQPNEQMPEGAGDLMLSFHRRLADRNLLSSMPLVLDAYTENIHRIAIVVNTPDDVEALIATLERLESQDRLVILASQQCRRVAKAAVSQREFQRGGRADVLRQPNTLIVDGYLDVAELEDFLWRKLRLAADEMLLILPRGMEVDPRVASTEP